jgi:hypothetical protein
MEKFAEYLAAFDGATDWESVAPLYDAAFHDEAIFVTADGEYGKAEWVEMVKGLRAKGAVASDFEVTDAHGDTILYKVTITAGGAEPMHLAARGTIRDGQLARVEPIDPGAYSEMVRRSS